VTGALLPPSGTLYSSTTVAVSWAAQYTTRALLELICKSPTSPPGTRGLLSLTGALLPSSGTLYSSSTLSVSWSAR
jgi:hypothetical protein